MSHDATAWARAQKTGSTSAKFILLLLADYAGTDYSCYPSVKKLADISEMGESTVRAATKLLAELGLLRVFYRHRPNGSRRSCRYQLLIDGPDTAEPDAEDWADHRRISADAMRQDSAEAPPESSGGTRQDLALIPIKGTITKEPPQLPGASQPPKATRIPDDFYPSPEMQAWFRDEQLHTVIANPKAEHDSFCDYWRAKAGAGARKLDWPATWRNWMRRAAKSRGANYGPGQARARQTTDEKVMQGLALVEHFQQMEDNR